MVVTLLASGPRKAEPASAGRVPPGRCTPRGCSGRGRGAAEVPADWSGGGAGSWWCLTRRRLTVSPRTRRGGSVQRALPETNRWRPARPAAGRRTHTSVASSRPSCPLVPRVGDDVGSGVQPDSAGDGAAALGQRRADLADRPGDRGAGTLNQQANTSWVTPWRGCTRVASSRSMNTSRCRAPAPTARWRGRSASLASRHACQRGPSSLDQLSHHLPGQPSHPAIGDSGGSGQSPRHTPTLPRPSRARRPANHARGR